MGPLQTKTFLMQTLQKRMEPSLQLQEQNQTPILTQKFTLTAAFPTLEATAFPKMSLTKKSVSTMKKIQSHPGSSAPSAPSPVIMP